MPDVTANDQAYLNELSRVVQSNAQGAVDPTETIEAAIYWQCIKEEAELALSILNGESSPWHDKPPTGYIAVMEGLRNDPHFLDNLGPIEVIPDAGS